MTNLYLKRFGELNDQLLALFGSRKNFYDETLHENRETVDGTALLEWAVKTKNLLAKSCGEDSEHYKAFVENQTTHTWTTYLEPRWPPKFPRVWPLQITPPLAMN